jgi:hypothetical protein
MSSGHSELGPELRQLAQALLERLDPAVRAAAAMAAEAMRGPERCQQVWCPVCALAALINGEQHPLLGVIAEHSVALLSVIQTMAADTSAGAPEPQPAQTPDAENTEAGPPPSSSGRYHPIEIIVETDPGQDSDA